MKYSFSSLGKYGIVTVISLGILASCSSDDDFTLNTDLYSGKDISSYARFTTDNKTKEIDFEFLKGTSWSLFSGNTMSTINFESPLLSGNGNGKYKMQNTTFRIYCLEAENARTTLGVRQLPLQGQNNFRDLGGYKTANGEYVKWGTVFRSGKCNELTGNDLSFLSSIPLKTVVDFRSNDERNSEPNKVPASVVNQIHLPINPGNLSSIDIREAITNGDYEKARQYLIDGNREFITSFQQEYKDFFATLMQEENTPLVFHCTAGKDRAGLAAALFLSSLGVDRETVIEDYLLTNVFTEASLEKMQETYGNNNTALAMYYLYSVQREYIETAFSTIEENYGSVENFLVSQLNVDLNKMKQLYLYKNN